jgi:lipoyl-dependent peroxiredoxin
LYASYNPESIFFIEKGVIEMPVRTSSAEWEGSIQDGKGKMRLGDGVYEGSYSYGSRFKDSPGTNPEELLGAAHAGCFSMALAGGISKAGFKVKRIKTTAKVNIQLAERGWKITNIDLETVAVVPEIEEMKFQQLAEEAKNNCPVSQALASVPISLDAKLMQNVSEKW